MRLYKWVTCRILIDYMTSTSTYHSLKCSFSPENTFKKWRKLSYITICTDTEKSGKHEAPFSLLSLLSNARLTSSDTSSQCHLPSGYLRSGRCFIYGNCKTFLFGKGRRRRRLLLRYCFQGRSCLYAKYASAYQNFLPLILFFLIWRFIIQEKWKFIWIRL